MPPAAGPARGSAHPRPAPCRLLVALAGKKANGGAAQRTVSYPDNLTYRGEDPGRGLGGLPGGLLC